MGKKDHDRQCANTLGKTSVIALLVFMQSINVDLVSLDSNQKSNWAATDLAVLDVVLLVYARVHQNLNGLPAVRATDLLGI
jgi:hypothetical protein